jgi:hypothetical protein
MCSHPVKVPPKERGKAPFAERAVGSDRAVWAT